MGTYVLGDAEEYLCIQTQHGDPAEFKDRTDKTIRAEVIRHMVIGLPLVEDKRGIWTAITKAIGASSGAIKWPVTGVGITIWDALIDEGPLDLDSAIGDQGGPIYPLEFRYCHFAGGFTGANAHFARLSFRDCTFGKSTTPSRKTVEERDGRPARAVPTINLAGARVDGDLDLGGIGPKGDDDVLWIRAPGIRVDGEIDLSCCRLRAPDPVPGRKTCEEAEDALDLTLAEIKGDLQFLSGSRSEGRVKLRAAQFGGDIWMRGATIEVAREEALFLQGARIAGFLMMDGGWDYANQRGTYRPFRCRGKLNLRSANVGRSLYLKNAVIRGEIEAPDLIVQDDLFFGAEVGGDVDLIGSRIGGSLDLSQLNLASSVNSASLKDANIGRALKLVQAGGQYELVKARRTNLRSLPKLQLIETLWALRNDPDQRDGPDEEVRDERALVQAAFLVYGARVFHLDGHAESLEGAARRYSRTIGAETAPEYARIHGAYVLSGDGLFRLVTRARLNPSAFPEFERESTKGAIAEAPAAFFSSIHVPATSEEAGGRDGESDSSTGRGGPPAPVGPVVFALEASAVHDGLLARWRFTVTVKGTDVDVCRTRADGESFVLEKQPRLVDGLLMPPRLPKDEMATLIRKEDWFSNPPVEGMSDFSCSAKLARRMAPYVQPKPLLQGVIDLEGLSCGMLDDHAGRAWGWHFNQIKMNHFTYDRTTWIADGPPKEPGLRATPVKGLLHRLSTMFENQPYRVLEFIGRVVGDWSVNFGKWWQIQGAEHLPKGVIWLFNWNDRFRYGDHWTSIQLKRNWIYRMFDTSGLSSSSKYRIHRKEYRSQPFEQAAKVARAEGRSDYANYLEILKERIEWGIFISQNRGWFILGGALVAGGWLWLRSDLDEPTRGWSALLIFLALSFLPHIANLVMRWGFGYLRRPIRAISTLIIAFLIGWAGVSTANDRGMLVVDVAPVAGLVGEDAESVIIGSEREQDRARVSDPVPCGRTIDEALYALDVLIPLIDLRQESRCQVGRAAPVDGRRTGAHAVVAAGLEATKAASPRAPVATASIFDPETIWAMLKALYAIAGWLFVSLAILTFVHVARARSEPS